MLRIQRLNMDSSWKLKWHNTTVLIDPWLIDTQIDYFKWFSEQWHAVAPVDIASLKNYDAVLISQPYTDHCHDATLQALPPTKRYAVPSAAKILAKNFESDSIKSLPSFEKNIWQKCYDFEVAYLAPVKRLSALFYGLVLKYEQQVIVYCPHGFQLTQNQLELLKSYEVKLLICNFSSYKLPFFLGGYVNPGKQNALNLIEQLNPSHIVHTHDENKKASGLVSQLAKVHFANYNEIGKTLGNRFVYIDNLEKEYSLE